eukprot:2478576-Rhodomonas_salina.2
MAYIRPRYLAVAVEYVDLARLLMLHTELGLLAWEAKAGLLAAPVGVAHVLAARSTAGAQREEARAKRQDVKRHM